MKRFSLSLLCLIAAIASVQAEDLNLPDALTTASGEKVTSMEMWKNKRRPELLEIFRENVFGRMPVNRPPSLKFTTINTDPKAMGGQATLKQVTISYSGPGGDGAIHLSLFVPNRKEKPAPCFLLICNRGVENIDPTREKKSPFWPAEDMIGRGYAAAAFFNGDVARDKADAWKSGAHAIFDPAQRAPDAWGTIAAWAWGASRCMDYLETDHDIDKTRVAVIGHSRGGKTALWAGAEDTRFAMVCSNDAGCTGSKLARHLKGESIEAINTHFPHWFCENYKKFNGHPEALPVDFHELIGLIAPRPVYIASASEDTDPEGEFLGAVNASPVYALFGLPGLSAKEYPKPDTTFQVGLIGYHLRPGPHNLIEYDWTRYMDFFERHLERSARFSEGN